MNVIDAAHATVHDYHGGSVALAPRINMAPAVLRGKVNCNDDRHHLTLAEAQRIQSLTGDHRILMAMADELGYLLVPLPNIDSADFASEAMRTVKEFGEFIGACGEAMADGKVSLNELHKVDTELLQAMAHISRLHQMVASRVGK